MHNSPRVPVTSPWGPIQRLTPCKKVDGVYRAETSRCNGFYVADWRRQIMPACMKMYQPPAGDGWYEESTEWAVVYASFHELITTDQLAYETVVTLGYYTTVDDGSFAGRIDRARYFNTIPGGAVLRRANAFFAENQHKFVVAAVMPSKMATRKHPDWVQVAATSYDACSFMVFDLPRYPDFSGPFTQAEAIKAGATKFILNPR